MTERFPLFYHQTGPIICAFRARAILKSLETLPLRFKSQTQSATATASELEMHNKVKRVYYPGLSSYRKKKPENRQTSVSGSIFALEINGGRENEFTFLNALNLHLISGNLRGSMSFLTHSDSTIHQDLSKQERALIDIKEGHLRISSGLEHQDDLIAYILQALSHVS